MEKITMNSSRLVAKQEVVALKAQLERLKKKLKKLGTRGMND
jgi:hypothetical protein